jgi:acyl-CoA synthetase (AMP-forming)/AMP-acid ligase II
MELCSSDRQEVSMHFSPRKFSNDTPNKPAYIMAETGEVVTYRQLEERANQCAHLFRSLGLRAGDHIALLMENNRYFLEIVWAAQRSGLYYTPISRHLKSSEVAYIVEDCQANVLLSSAGLVQIAEELPGQINRSMHWLVVAGVAKGYQSYENLVSSFPIEPVEDELEGADMLYTSGTTGRPKGVLPGPIGGAFGEDVVPAAKQALGMYEYSQDMVYLSPAPLYHAAPLRFCLLVHRYGGTAIIMDRFDAIESLKLIERYRITHSQWVPTMFVRMLKLSSGERKRHNISSLQVAIHGAAPISLMIKEQMIDWWGPILIEYYAGTEGAGVTIITSEEWLEHKGSVGKASVGVVHILDEEGGELEPHETGVVYFSGGKSFEYFNDEDKTAESRSPQGYATMGDIGHIDDDGYLYLTDRKADVIISGGVNIYPQESEKVLIGHPKVADVAVFGVPNEEFGEEVKAVVQTVNMKDVGKDLEEELILFCHSHIAKLKCPVSIDFRETLPRTATGKLIKRALKDEYTRLVRVAS